MKIDVIIPVYNSEKTIEKTIDSVLAQTNQVSEIIIVDDCSIDETQNIVKRRQKNLTGTKIVYIKNNKNLGAGASRNTGLQASKSRYVAFLDSDDYWLPNHLESLIDALDKSEWAVFAYANYKYYIPTSGEYSNCSQYLRRHKYQDQLQNTLISTPSVLIDKKQVGNIEFLERRTGQDYALWLSLLKVGDACGVGSCSVVVQKMPNSLSKSKIQSAMDIYQIQVECENIPRIIAFWNTVMFVINAVIKRKKFWKK